MFIFSGAIYYKTRVHEMFDFPVQSSTDNDNVFLMLSL